MQKRKRFGQHFLRDKHVLSQMVACINPTVDQHVVEIGPGQGALTRYIVDHVKQLDLIELDRDLIAGLEQQFPGEHVCIHNQDVLTFDFNQLSEQAASLRIIGNLPYNISTPLLFYLCEFSPIIRDMHFLLQKEVVQRICAQVNEAAYGRLSVMAQYFYQPIELFVVPPVAFDPPPKVDSAYVRLTPVAPKIAAKDFMLFKSMVRDAFCYRRKTIRNALKSYVSAEQLIALDIDPGVRPQQLSMQDYIKISNSLTSP